MRLAWTFTSSDRRRPTTSALAYVTAVAVAGGGVAGLVTGRFSAPDAAHAERAIAAAIRCPKSDAPVPADQATLATARWCAYQLAFSTRESLRIGQRDLEDLERQVKGQTRSLREYEGSIVPGRVRKAVASRVAGVEKSIKAARLEIEATEATALSNNRAMIVHNHPGQSGGYLLGGVVETIARRLCIRPYTYKQTGWCLVRGFG